MTARNKKYLMGSTAVMVALSPLAAMQLHAADVNVPAMAAINSFVWLLDNTDMNFATFTQNSAGTVRLDFTDNVLRLNGGLNPVAGSPTTGNITVKVLPGQQVKVSGTAATYKVTTLGGGAPSKSMTVSNINYRIGPLVGPNLTLTPTAATNVMDVGADLKASGGQLDGAYTGNIKVIVTQP